MVAERAKISGATVEVINNYLVSTVEQMRRTLVRTAFNPVIYEVLDFGISMYDSQVRLVAEAPGITAFLGANDYSILKGLDYIGRENLAPGDIVMMNYPYWSSAHAYDALLFAPVFEADDEPPVAYLCVRAHWMDLGAKDPAYVLDATSMHQEGLIFPGTKLVKRGKADKELLELIRFNSRLPDLVIGDFHAQVAAIRIGERRLGDARRAGAGDGSTRLLDAHQPSAHEPRRRPERRRLPPRRGLSTAPS
jgi:N-methylhydantoinase B